MTCLWGGGSEAALQCDPCGCKLCVNLLPGAPQPRKDDPQIQHCQTQTAPSAHIKGPVTQFWGGPTSSLSQQQPHKTGLWLAPQISVRTSFASARIQLPLSSRREGSGLHKQEGDGVRNCSWRRDSCWHSHSSPGDVLAEGSAAAQGGLDEHNPPSLSVSMGKECGSFTLLNFSMELFNVTGATTSLWSSSCCSGGSLESVGSTRCCSSAEEEAEVCGEQGLLCLELFFQVVVLKKGNKQSKETSPATACLPAKAFFGQGWSLASFATKELARTSYFQLCFCGGSCSVLRGAPV